jgi:cytochrome c oxidase subunit II
MPERLLHPLRHVLLIGACLGLAACLAACHDQPQNMFAPGGPAGRRLADLGWFVLVTFLVVTVVMWALVVWIACRRTGTLETHAPWDAPGEKRWILIGGLAIPIVILAVIFVVGLQTMAAFPLDGGMHEEHAAATIRLVGHQWWWEVHYLPDTPDQLTTTANDIHVPVGRPIDIALESQDVIHSFWVPQLHGKVDLVPGMVNRIRIQADRPGRYRGECAEYCGPQHAHMILAISADAPADYDRWLAHQHANAATPATASARTGEQIFMNRQCALCHTIRGTDAHGLVGPDLTHLASRPAIAANAFPNDSAYLATWVMHAQSLKPGAQMPDILAFNGEELRALVDYLQTLQ